MVNTTSNCVIADTPIHAFQVRDERGAYEAFAPGDLLERLAEPPAFARLAEDRPELGLDADDILVLDPAGSPRDGDLVSVESRGLTFICRVRVRRSGLVVLDDPRGGRLRSLKHLGFALKGVVVATLRPAKRRAEPDPAA